MNEEQCMCWITISWTYFFDWLYSWDNESNINVSEEISSAPQIQWKFLLYG